MLYNAEINDKEYYFFRNSEFHAACATIFSQMNYNFPTVKSYNVNTKRCLLCLNEELQSAIYRGNNMLNKPTEIISKCRHRNKYALASYDSMDFNITGKVEVS